MRQVLLERPPWFLAGPLLGLVVVALFATINERLGVLGGYSDVVERLTGRSRALGWKAWFLLGVVAGGALFGVLSGGAGAEPAADGYGWLSRAAGANEGLVVASVLLVAGVLIGFGAKTAGGCTSGNGFSGTAIGSRASVVATATFMATAVAVAFATEWLFL